MMIKTQNTNSNQTYKTCYKKVIKYIESIGYKKTTTKGSHLKYRNGNSTTIIVYRKGNYPILKGTLIRMLLEVDKITTDININFFIDFSFNILLNFLLIVKKFKQLNIL